MATPLLTGPNLGITLRPMLSEVWCGDLAAAWTIDGRVVLCMIDGLGHGEQAAVAALAALTYFSEHWSWDGIALLRGCDRAISHSRGAALAVAAIDPEARSLTFAGVGNIRLVATGKQCTRNLLAIPGIVGAGRLQVRPEILPLDGMTCVIMVSDGIESSLNLSGCPCSLFDDMEALASAIVNGWGRGHDDAGVIAWRCPKSWQLDEEVSIRISGSLKSGFSTSSDTK